MAENRYNGLLKKYNTDIVLVTANDPLKVYVTHELRKVLGNKKNARVLEIGCGEWELTKHLLAYTKDTIIDLLDPSRSMLRACKKNLSDTTNRLRYICKDISDYLVHEENYDAIVSSQVIHNFTQSFKQDTFSRIYKALYPGGVYIMTDKVYPDDNALRDDMFEIQNRRYRDYLPPHVAQAIIEHEKQDMSDPYRMEESSTLQTLIDTWFTEAMVIDRIERDVVIKARK
jgi:ubiquinone/menaquinone biosynthesis C-methylase UbiE